MIRGHRHIRADQPQGPENARFESAHRTNRVHGIPTLVHQPLFGGMNSLPISPNDAFLAGGTVLALWFVCRSGSIHRTSRATI
jgi:hypothetical protein